MTYECVSPGVYDITLTVYRDDSTPGAPFDSIQRFPGWIGIFDEDEFFVDSIPIGNPVSVVDLPTDLDPCIEDPPTIAVQKGVYRITNVSLSPSQKWYLKYSRCCRRAGITNLNSTGGNTGNSFIIEIPAKADAACNSSPVFNNEPPPFQCFATELRYDGSATDPDGDQLVYELCEPLGSVAGAILAQGPNVTSFETEFVAYASGYDYDFPFGNDGDLSLDENTGIMTLVSDFQGFYTISYCVKEFRNGVLIATYPRDFLYLIDDCVIPYRAVLPELIVECNGFDVCFENNSTTSPPGLETIYRWDFGDPTTLGDTLRTTEDTTVCYNYSAAGVGTYTVTLTARGPQPNSCVSEATVEVNVFPFTTPNFNANNGCADEFLTFNGSSGTAVGDAVNSFNWDFNNDGIIDQTGQSVSHQFGTHGNQQVTMFIETVKGCRDSVQRSVEVYAVPEADFSYSDPCVGSIIDFNNHTSLATNDAINYQWLFTGGTPSVSLQENPQNISFGLNDIHKADLIATTSPFGCDDTISREFFVTDELDANFSVAGPVCDHVPSVVTYTGNGLVGDYYTWDFGSGSTILSGTGRGPYLVVWNLNNSTPANRTVQLEVDILDCTASESFTIQVNPNPEPEITNLPRYVCVGDTATVFYTTGNTPPRFEPGLTVAPHSSGTGFVLDPSALELNIDYLVVLEVTNQFSCINSIVDTITLKRPSELTLLPIDSIYCQNNGDAELIAVPTGGVFSGDAVFTNNQITTFNPLLNESTGIHQIQYDFTNQFGCRSSINETIEVIDPSISISDDVRINYGEDFQIEGVVNDFGYLYDLTWIPADSLSCNDCPSPLANPEFTTEYTVTLINEQGCMDEESIRIEVFINRGLFVPNAFTPNEDNVNDVVFVNGRDIKTVKHFSVYNRWGGKVFEVTDALPNDPSFGWDGIFDGELLNSAVFVYHVEVEFVDGVTAQDKGSILLIR